MRSSVGRLVIATASTAERYAHLRDEVAFAAAEAASANVRMSRGHRPPADIYEAELADRTKSPPPAPKTPVTFFRSPAGREPVRDWLKSLPEADRRKVGQDLMRVQYSWQVGMPLVDGLGSGLYEVRTSLGTKREARVYFCEGDALLVLLDGQIKKTRTADLKLARRRMTEFEKESR